MNISNFEMIIQGPESEKDLKRFLDTYSIDDNIKIDEKKEENDKIIITGKFRASLYYVVMKTETRDEEFIDISDFAKTLDNNTVIEIYAVNESCEMEEFLNIENNSLSRYETNFFEKKIEIQELENGKTKRNVVYVDRIRERNDLDAD